MSTRIKQHAGVLRSTGAGAKKQFIVPQRRALRFGTRLRNFIHAAIELLPNAVLPERIKVRLKNCPGCAARVQRLNRRVPIVHTYVRRHGKMHHQVNPP